MSDSYGVTPEISKALLERLHQECEWSEKGGWYPNTVQVSSVALCAMLEAYHRGTLADLVDKMDFLEAWLARLFEVGGLSFREDDAAQSPAVSSPARRYIRADPQAEALAQRDGGWYCHYCHAPVSLNPGEGELAAEKDHKHPRAHGGGNELDNLVLACGPCNRRKGARRTYEEFYALTADTRASRAYPEVEHVTAG